MRDAGRGNVGRTARAIKSLIIPLRHFISLGRAARKVGKMRKAAAAAAAASLLLLGAPQVLATFIAINFLEFSFRF